MSQMSTKWPTVCFLEQPLTVNGGGNNTEGLVLFQMVQDVVHKCILTVAQDYASCLRLILGKGLVFQICPKQLRVRTSCLSAKVVLDSPFFPEAQVSVTAAMTIFWLGPKA